MDAFRIDGPQPSAGWREETISHCMPSDAIGGHLLVLPLHNGHELIVWELTEGLRGLYSLAPLASAIAKPTISGPSGPGMDANWRPSIVRTWTSACATTRSAST